MNDADKTLGAVEVRWGSDRYKYYVIDDSFFTEWTSGMDCSKTSVHLRGLSPRLIETSGRSSSTTQTVRISLLLIASSIIVFFSDYNKTIPLLAPFLLFLGGWWVANALRKVIPRKWTVVRKRSGEDAFFLVQPEKKSDDWLRFEKDLSGAINKANPSET